MVRYGKLTLVVPPPWGTVSLLHTVIIPGEFVPGVYPALRAVAAFLLPSRSFGRAPAGTEKEFWISSFQVVGCIRRARAAEPSADVAVGNRIIDRGHFLCCLHGICYEVPYQDVGRFHRMKGDTGRRVTEQEPHASVISADGKSDTVLEVIL